MATPAPAGAIRTLLPFALGWAIANLFAEPLDALGRRVADPDAGPLQEMVQVGVVLAVALVVGWAVTRALRAVRPGMLEVPHGTTLGSLAGWYLLLLPFVFVATALLAAAIVWWGWVVPHDDPEHSQYGLAALFAAVFYPTAIAPTLGLVAAWAALRWQARRRAGAGR